MANCNIQIAGAAIFLIDRDVIYDFFFFFSAKMKLAKKVLIDRTIDSAVIWYVSLTTMAPSNP